MEHTGGSSRRTDALTNRARLLEVAQAVFAEDGLDLEVNDIATRARLGVGTLYRHFGNREDLLRTIVIQIIEEAQMRTSQAIQPYRDDPRVALQALVSEELRMYQQYQPLFATMRDRRLEKLFDATQRETLRAQLLEPARGVITRGMQSGVFREDLNPDLAVAIIIGTFTSVFELLGKSYPLDELEQQLSRLLWTMFAQREE